jgi:phosphate starvation-inducible PhoH-like protein
MKMFLTRLGFDSRAVITGDITQIDLPVGKQSGLIEASRILKKITGIGFCSFSDVDVVRHPLVQQIIRAYAKKEKNAGNLKSKSRRVKSVKK